MDNPGQRFMKEVLDEMNRQGINKKELARRLGVSQPSVTIYFHAKNPTMGTLSKITKVIGCTYEIKLITPSTEEDDSIGQA